MVGSNIPGKKSNKVQRLNASTVRFEDPDRLLPFDAARLEKISHRVVQENRAPPIDVTIVFVDEVFITDLNQRFLGKDEPTDVLAFDLGKTPPFSTDIGEVYISVECAREQAEAYHVSFEEEIARLTIHGLLHLSGYDDETAVDRNLMHKRMEAYLHTYLQVEI